MPAAGQIISAYNTAKCTDDNDFGTANGTAIQIWDCNGQSNQQWTLEPNGTIQVYGKCMDISGANYSNGTLVQLWTCNGGCQPAVAGRQRTARQPHVRRVPRRPPLEYH